MRRFILYIIAGCCLMACQSAFLQKMDEPERIIVHLGIADDSQTKATNSDNLYGINVYYDPARDGNSNTHYAYGLFDNKEDMSITLLSGYTYKFECTLVKEGKSTLYCGQYGGNSFSGYAKPFQTNESSSTPLSNSFVYGTTFLSGIYYGDATVMSVSTGYEDQTMPSIQRYYGEISGYTPVAGGIVIIPLKKTVFGVRMIIDKEVEGRMNADCVLNTNSSKLLSGTATSKLYDSGAILFSYPDVRSCWANEDQMNATVNWNFYSSIFGGWNNSGSKTITFKRNTLTTITVSYTPDNSSGTIFLQEEGLGEENKIFLYLNSDGIIVIGIEPNPEDD